MTCYLLHMIEAPDPDPYHDQDLKDLIGQVPQLFCAFCTPPAPMSASEASRCLERTAPCWKTDTSICT